MSENKFIEDFLKRLIKGPRDSGSRKKIVSEFRKALLDAFSETDDNRNCARHITLKNFKLLSGDRAVGWAVTPSQTVLSDIIHSLEDDEVFQFLRVKHPGVSQEEIEAALRLATLGFSTIERTILKKPTTKKRRKAASKRS